MFEIAGASVLELALGCVLVLRYFVVSDGLFCFLAASEYVSRKVSFLGGLVGV